MASYVLYSDTVERFEEAARRVLDEPGDEIPLEGDPTRGTSIHRAVFVTEAPVDGRQKGLLMYRDEETATWQYFDPEIEVWAIGHNDEVLDLNRRYPGKMESVHPVDGLAVYAVAVGGGGGVRPVFVTGPAISGRYPARIDYRDENVPDWYPVDPAEIVWAIGYNNEALTLNRRYKGLLVSINPADGVPVYSCTHFAGGGGPPSAFSGAHLQLQANLELGPGFTRVRPFETVYDTDSYLVKGDVIVIPATGRYRFESNFNYAGLAEPAAPSTRGISTYLHEAESDPFDIFISWAQGFNVSVVWSYVDTKVMTIELLAGTRIGISVLHEMRAATFLYRRPQDLPNGHSDLFVTRVG